MRTKARGRRAAVALAAVAAVLTGAPGCITVHGEEAVVPATTEAEAEKVLEHFTETNNEANRTHDAELNATIETGALGAIDQAGLRARHTADPGGEPGHEPLELTDPRFLIPRQAGWPKFFVADTASNRSPGKRWLLVFTRGGIDEDWKVSYLAVLNEAAVPDFAEDGEEYVEEVPTGETAKLAVAPRDLSRGYTDYLREGGDTFAAGPLTSGLREERKKNSDSPGARTEWADLPAEDARFAPVGLRTEDGGALVFFTSHHQMKQTVAEGFEPQVKDPLLRALLEGEPEQSVTYVRVAVQAASVPAADAADPKVTVVYRLQGVTALKGG
ncbi:hypothetical protein V1L54_10830 [Streptomyces sp. TRM 70361]|uniref:hypothetical protein n=1 Tax=Streptomyces sp. TRM 70361 TaxID=3116553 RepID=UPI002E7B0C1A|nr:hypothetical protein [Streptomyces sp. TRM 70361]MEE1939895.1 hypothetical protein [Streptomyces sp. TRM 70361]